MGTTKPMSSAEKRALELYPPKYIRETWVRADPDINAPLRAAYIQGWKDRTRLAESQHNNVPKLKDSKL